MSVTALYPYEFEPLDKRENFPAPLLYIGWEDHLMYCAPVPADTPFSALTGQILPGVYGEHPDFEQVDWSRAEWFKSGQPWTPNPDLSLEQNGLGHKDVIRFRTPGLTGIEGSCS